MASIWTPKHLTFSFFTMKSPFLPWRHYRTAMVVGQITGIECLPGGVPPPDPPAPYSIHQSSSPRRHMHGIAVCAPRAHRAKKNSRIPQERVPRRFFLSRLRARCPAHSPAHMAPKQQLPEGGNAPPKTTAHTRQQSTEPRARGATDDLSPSSPPLTRLHSWPDSTERAPVKSQLQRRRPLGRSPTNRRIGVSTQEIHMIRRCPPAGPLPP